MKLKLGSTLIFGFGGLLAIGLSYQLHSNRYMAVLAPFLVWAWLYAYEEINIDSWHYSLASRYFEGVLKLHVCKVCPYWGLVLVAAGILLLELIARSVTQVLMYVWTSIWWLFSLKPSWRTNAYRYMFFNEGYLFRREPDTRKMAKSWVWPIYFVGPAAIIIGELHLGTAQVASFYHDTQFYYTVPLTYVAVLAFVGLGELWNVTGWPTIKWAYSKGCPDAKFVQKVPAPAKPAPPSADLPSY